MGLEEGTHPIENAFLSWLLLVYYGAEVVVLFGSFRRDLVNIKLALCYHFLVNYHEVCLFYIYIEAILFTVVRNFVHEGL